MSGIFGVAEDVPGLFAITPEDASANERHAEVSDAQPGKFSAEDIGDEGASGGGSDEGDETEYRAGKLLECSRSFTPGGEGGCTELTLLPCPEDG